MKLKPFRYRHAEGGKDERGGFSFWCPGCEEPHGYYTVGPQAWTFNGNLDKPSFSPSLLLECPKHPDPKQRRCHLFLTDGVIHYCSDSTHALAGKSVPLTDHWPDKPSAA